MGKISSLSDEIRFELIGYLAQPGIVSSITAEVPKKKCAEFEEKYGVTPYPVNSEKKYGDQYRIYLADPEGCPQVLKDALDIKYGRLNDTVFIRELVDDFGFSFFKPLQDIDTIKQKAKHKGSKNYLSFCKGLNSSSDFIAALSESISSGETASPVIQTIADKMNIKSQKKKSVHPMFGDSNAGLSEEQLLHLGWAGEQYFYNLLKTQKEYLLPQFGINPSADTTVTWFNEGYDSANSWNDKSVGKGCDILINDGARTIYIEVKTSKRKSPVFAMTSFEMQTMERMKNDFYLVKIDDIENLLTSHAPNIRIFTAPFEYFFVPDRMHSAVFYCN